MLTNAISLYIIDYFSASIAFSDTMAVFMTALILTLLNMTIKPILKVISMPISFLTFGLFSLVINGIVLYAAFAMSDGSAISSFGAAIWIAIVLAVLNSVIGKILGD